MQISYTKHIFAVLFNYNNVLKHLIFRHMPRKKKKKISIEEIKNRAPKVVFYTDKLRINLSSISKLSFWFDKYPNGKYIVHE